jgi:hypothetical protein
LTAAVLFVLIPDALEVLRYGKALEEEVIIEPEASVSPKSKA